MTDLAIRRAGIGDSETVLSILNDAAAWLHARRIDQWRQDTLTDEDVVHAILSHEVFLAYAGGCAPIGTVTVQWSDPAIWGPDSGDESAAYLRRLAVRPEWTGQGLGRKILAWAAEYARASGKRLLRLDCWAGNERLRRYYEEAGFVLVDEVPEQSWRIARFERWIAG